MDKKTIKKIVSKSIKKRIIKIKSVIGKGDVNRIFILDLEDKKILIRINEKHDGVIEFKKEVWCIKRAKEKGILGPNVLSIGRYGNFSYMIYEFIEGKSGKEIKDKKEIWKVLGIYAKRINSIKVKGFGLQFSSKENKFIESWEKFIDYNINSLSKKDKLIELSIYKESQLNIIKKLFLSFKKKKFDFGLVHNDLSLRNVVVNDERKVFLIDWGCAEANIVPHAEFVEILGAGHIDLKIPSKEEINSFLIGYGISKNQFNILKKDISKFLLLVSFDKLRWAIDKNPKKIKEMSKIAKNRLNFALKINQK